MSACFLLPVLNTGNVNNILYLDLCGLVLLLQLEEEELEQEEVQPAACPGSTVCAGG